MSDAEEASQQNSCLDVGKRTELDFQARITEYNALRAEFLARLQIENVVVLAGQTILGTLLGLYFGMENPNLLPLLAVSFVLPLLGFFYINQRLTNTSLGTYVRDRLRPRLKEITQTDVFDWEIYVRDNTSFVREICLFVFILFVFLLPT